VALEVVAGVTLLSDAAQCRGLLDADGAARRGEGVIAMSSWPAALTEVEQTTDCAALGRRAVGDDALQAFLLRHQQFGRDVASPMGGGRLDASRWRLTLALPPTLAEQRASLGALQRTLDGYRTQVPLTLVGATVEAVEVTVDAPGSAIGWAAWAVAAAVAASFMLFDPAAVLLLLLGIAHAAALLLGAMSLMPAPGGALVAWVAVVLAHSLYGVAGTLDAYVHPTSEEMGEGEMAALARVAPPQLRSAACSLLMLLPGAFFFPMGYVRSVLLLLAGSVLLVLLDAIVVLPLLHATLRPQQRALTAAPAAPRVDTPLVPTPKMQHARDREVSYNTV
jgi:hypothetical protein